LHDRLQINTHWLEDDEIDVILRRLNEELDARVD